MRPRAKFWLETETGEYLMGPRTLRLLEAVHAEGSLKAGARAAGFSYRSAWARVRRVEAALGFKLIESHSGGEGGGQSRLTPEALDFVQRFRAFLERSERFLQEAFEDAFA
ncbi:MAG TPA: LysR family transcriptional regulator [Oceanithermus profundus]|uniref:LysR family transcriptional regulator n=1 Tax=Oceanithermus profundus TaxID=187137 RepID=A0A7C4Z6K2_9DEIN|nr:LysR family transcriptional regulator [Oceanithermus profundus]